MTSSKRRLGGGFKTLKQVGSINLVNMKIKNKRNRIAEQNKKIKQKISQLKDFDLGLSSETNTTHTESGVHVTESCRNVNHLLAYNMSSHVPNVKCSQKRKTSQPINYNIIKPPESQKRMIIIPNKNLRIKAKHKDKARKLRVDQNLVGNK